MKYTILLFALLISSATFAQEQAQPKRVNINQLAPHLPVVKNPDPSKDDLKILGNQIEDWMEEHYSEFDVVRNHIISMFLDGDVHLFTMIGTTEMDATPIYRLKGWEMNYGLTEEEWQPLWQRIQEYRAQHSEE